MTYNESGRKTVRFYFFAKDVTTVNVYGKKGALVFALYSAFCAVTLLVPFGKAAAGICFAAVTLALVLYLILSKKKASAIFMCVLCLVSSSLGFLSGYTYTNKISSAQKFADENEHTICAEITYSVYEKQFGSLYYARLSSIDGEKVSSSVEVAFPYLPDIALHDKIKAAVLLSEPDGDEASLLKSKGVFLCAEVKSFSITESGGDGTLPERINAYLDGILHKSIGGDEADFASAIFLGNKGEVSQKIKLAFRRCGASHLLALSGLHLSVLAAGLEFALRAIRVKKKIRIGISALATVLFALVTGLSASVMRAAIMLIIYFASQLIGEERDSLTSLFVALALIIAVRRYAVWDAGLWMSFFATLGLVLFSDRLLPKFSATTRENYSAARKFFMGALKYVLGLLAASLVATLFTLPVTYIAFGGISLISPLSNLWLVPLAQLLLYLLPFVCFLSKVPLLGDVLVLAARGLIKLICSSAKLFSSSSGVYISIKYPFAPYLIGGFVIIIAVIVFVPKIKPRAVIAAALSLCIVFAGCLGIWYRMIGNDIYAVCVNEKSSDAVSVVYRGRSFVIDVSTGGFAASYSAANETSGYAASEIDVYALTHLHRYHPATFDKLCGYYKINKLLLPTAESEADAKYISELLSIAEENDVKTEFYNRRADSGIECGDMKITLPKYITLRRSTHPVISFSVYLGEDEVMLYSGAALEEAVDESIYYDASLVIFGAHGPVIKQKLKTDACRSAQKTVFSNEKVYSFSEKADASIIISERGGKVSIKIKGKK